MALPRTVPSPGSTGWYPVARSADVGTAPLAVGAGDRPYVVLRLRPGAEVSALSARCPHRLVPLTVGSAVDGTLQCAYHGWRFNAEGRCVDIPSLGADGTPPPRADLSTPWAVEERDGWVWIAPDRTLHHRPPTASPATTADPVPELPEPAGPVFGNLDPSLEHAWHPVALAAELREGGWLAVRLLGRSWTVRRAGGSLACDPPAWGVRERHGVVWLAPAEPAGADLDLPEAEDPAFAVGWLRPARTQAPAGPLADNFLDVAHFPFVHAGTFGAADQREVPPYTVDAGPGGFGSVQDQWFDNPEDPAVQRGERPLRQRRRATYLVRAPFQLALRLEELDSGATKTILFLLQPEDAESTRVYTGMFLHGIGGATRVPRSVVAAELDFEQRVLDEDLALQERMDTTGLPLTMREELHVRADRLGVELRRMLSDFVVAAREVGAGEDEEDSDAAAA